MCNPGRYGNRKIIAVALSVAAVLVLAGCGGAVPIAEDDLVRSHELRPPFEVERTVHEHLVLIDPTKPEISEQERRNLFGFLVGVGVQPGDKVILASRRDRLEQRGSVSRFLRQAGVRPDVRLIKEAGANLEDDGYDRAVIVRFERYIAKSPECANWRQKVKTNYYNNSPSNFGCTNNAALAEQIAYPSSLIRGVTLDYPEGDVAAESVSRYRGRKVEAIQEESAGAQ